MAKRERKTKLTFKEKVQAAHWYYVVGMDQHLIAAGFGVNSGRINEACTAVKKALQKKPGE